MSDNLDKLSNKALKNLILETSETLSELKAELESREEEEQHAQIDKLETHMKNAELSLQTIKDFLLYLREELNSRKA